MDRINKFSVFLANLPLFRCLTRHLDIGNFFSERMDLPYELYGMSLVSLSRPVKKIKISSVDPCVRDFRDILEITLVNKVLGTNNLKKKSTWYSCLKFFTKNQFLVFPRFIPFLWALELYKTRPKGITTRKVHFSQQHFQNRHGLFFPRKIEWTFLINILKIYFNPLTDPKIMILSLDLSWPLGRRNLTISDKYATFSETFSHGLDLSY